MNFKGKKTIILEGGGFKTSFSAGVLDAFRMTHFDEFDVHIGVSGGSLALSYFLSEQYGAYFASMKTLCRDTRFIKFKKAFSEGLMNLDFFYDIAEKEFPFHLEKAVNKLSEKEFYIVLTNSLDGSTNYRQPEFNNWIDLTIAASTVPVLTKGKHYLDGIPYSDGGISDPIPVKWAMARMGKCRHALRLPLTRLSEPGQTVLENTLRQCGLIK
jgi:predicted patatin/cPLA2 family phospholipase